ncbi:FMN-binding negative transcriptional regulator [Rhodococcus sp. NPDC003322]
MYTPAAFALTEDETASALRRGGFAHLVSAGPGGLLTTSLPLLYDESRHAMVGHMARANPHWRDGADAQTVAIFSGVHGYVSPRYYPATAPTTRMAPTWNYEILTVHGRLVVHDDPDWLRTHVTAMTEEHERGRDKPWRVTEVEEENVTAMLRAIVGLELPIERVEAKAKLSQNQPDRNRQAVIDALAVSDDPGDHALAHRMTAEQPRNP